MKNLKTLAKTAFREYNKTDKKTALGGINAMTLEFDYNNMMSDIIGEHGIDSAAFAKNEKRIDYAFKSVMDGCGKGWQEWSEIPYMDYSELDGMIAEMAEVRKKATSFVVLGIGGSALGPIAVVQALLKMRLNVYPDETLRAMGLPRIYIEDNIDPERMAELIELIDLKTTYFNVITKSGETSETLSQLLVLYDLMKKAVGEEEAKEHFIATTTIGKGTLYNLAQAKGFRTYGIGPGIGGRFSVLSNVGLVPFAVMGIDIKKLLAGAKDMSEACRVADIRKNPGLLTAVLQYEASKKGANVSVMMPYADSLKYMSDFYCQIWAESLGKAVHLDGTPAHVGQTPVKSLGVTDQHSQVQLYTEGPFDKVITILGVKKFRKDVVIPDDPSVNACDFLKGHTMGELLNHERVATEYALKKAGRMNFTIVLPEVNETTVGELLAYYMYETSFIGALLSIDTFNQPGVEEGKKATFAMLGRAGYEAKLAEVRASIKKREYTIK